MQPIVQNIKLQFMAWLIFLLPSLSLMETTFSNKLTPANQQTSMQFKMQQGSNRIAEFTTLCQTVFNIQNAVPNTQYPITDITINELAKILGTATQIQNNQIYIYNLSYNNQKAVFTANQYKQITNCQLINN
jgi:hypothetical protein